MSDQWAATVTQDDLDFLVRAADDYRIWAEEMEKRSPLDREYAVVAGRMRAQEFHAERFLKRIRGEE